MARQSNSAGAESARVIADSQLDTLPQQPRSAAVPFETEQAGKSDL
jgi:hypothetical protein